MSSIGQTNKSGGVKAMMGEGINAIFAKADEHPRLSVAIILIVGVGALLGMVGTAFIGKGGIFTFVQYSAVTVGVSLGVTWAILYGVGKILGKKTDHLKWYQTLTRATKYAFLILGVGALAVGGGSILGGGSGMMAFGATALCGAALGIGSMFLLHMLNEKKGNKPWVRTLNKVIKVTVYTLAPFAILAILGYLLKGGPTSDLFFPGLMMVPALLPLCGKGVFELLKPRTSRVRMRKRLTRGKAKGKQSTHVSRSGPHQKSQKIYKKKKSTRTSLRNQV